MPTGRGQTSWLFIKRGEVEFGGTTNPSSGRVEDLNTGRSDYKSGVCEYEGMDVFQPVFGFPNIKLKILSDIELRFIFCIILHTTSWH